jgi:PAS domain S-box-containing protein
MLDASRTQYVRHPATTFSRCAAVVTSCIGIAVLIGWMLDIPAVTRIYPGLPTMKVNTAFCFVLLGVALWLSTADSTPTRPLRWLGQAAAAVAALLGMLTLVQYVFGVDLGVDRLLFHDQSSSAAALYPDRMAPNTALSVVLVGAALLALEAAPERRFRWTELLTIIAAMISFLALMGYLYGVKSLQGIGPYSSMAFHTVVTFLVLSAGILAARPERGWVSLLSGDSAGSVMGRRLLPAAILVPPLLGWLRTVGQAAGLYETEFGRALLVCSVVVVFTILIWNNVALLNRVDNERRRADASARQGQQLLQAIIDNAPAVIYAKDLQGRYLQVNRRFTELFQLDLDAVVGKTDFELFAKEVAGAFRAMDQRVIAARSPLTEEETAPLEDGLRTYLSVKCPLFDDTGKSYAMFGISTDITERKQAQAKLQLQLGQLSLLDQITRAIGQRQDLQSVFQVVTSTVEDRLPVDFACVCAYDIEQDSLTVSRVSPKGRTLAENVGLHEQARIDVGTNGLSRCLLGQLVHEADISEAQAPLTRQLARAGLRALVIAPLSVEGKVFGILVSARRAANSFSSSDCEFLRQLSEHVALAAHQAQLYGALQRAYDDLHQTQQAVLQQERLRALGQMASGIAHDINNAVSPIALYTDALLEREPGLSAEARMYLTTIRRAIEDVAQTVARMREFYRPRETQQALTQVSLNHLLEEVIQLTHARWYDLPQERGIVIELRRQLAQTLPGIMGAQSEIRDALTNLIFNAVDAMPEGGALEVRTHVLTDGADDAESHQSVCVEVRDSGIGMDEDTRRRCLEPFFTTKGERGTGLGLAMVFGMAQRHSAQLQIDSAVGQGTTFRLIFPVSAATSKSEEHKAPARVPSQPLRILVIDDDPLVSTSLRLTLEADGHAIVVADGGQAGIDAFHSATQRSEPFDVVMTDLGMPYVDGRKVAAAVRGASPATPVILLTGWGHRLLAENEAPPEVNRVLSKPPKLAELRTALAELTEADLSSS